MNKLLLASFFIAFSVGVRAQFWTSVDTDFPTESTGISRFDIVDDNITWGIGYNGINPDTNIQQFSRTMDAGITWQAGSISIGNVNLGIGDLDAINDQIAYITAYPRIAGQIGGVWKTENAGVQWTKVSQQAFNTASSFINAVHFFDSNNGVVMGDPVNSVWEIYTTSDAGNTFIKVAGSNIPAPLTGETGYLAQTSSSGDSIWFTTSKGRIYHSTNRGLNWNVYQSPITDFGGDTTSGDISFSTTTKGILQTQAGVLYNTTNAGQTWTLITLTGTGNPYGGSISYVPGTSIIVSVGSNPTFSGSSYSSNDGVSWTNIDTVQHVDVAFLNVTTGYSGGFTNSSDTGGVFVYSSNVLSVDDSAFAKAISLYPNPTSSQVNIATTATILHLELINLSGQNIRPIEPARSLSLEGLPAGMYMIKVTTDLGTQTLPLIKK